MTIPDLTPRQRVLLAVIVEHIRIHGWAPTVTELRENAEVGLASNSSVVHQLRQLAAKGYIRRGAGQFRAIAVLNPGEATQ